MVPNCKQLLGLVLSALNVAPLLRAAPHPLGPLAQDALRGSGGFEAKWRVGAVGLEHLRVPVSAYFGLFWHVSARFWACAGLCEDATTWIGASPSSASACWCCGSRTSCTAEG